jgi:FtsZ-interacting cell division protein ZipA
MDEREEIITIVFSILGFITIIIIICLIIWNIHRRKSKSIKNIQHTPISYQQQYQRSQKLTSNNIINNKRKKSKRRFNTNESDISFSFNPPHLINQNVKNLDKLLANKPSSVHYEDKQLDR